MSTVEIPSLRGSVIVNSFDNSNKIFEAAERRMEKPAPSDPKGISEAVVELRDMFNRCHSKEEIANAAAGFVVVLWHLKTHGVPVDKAMP